MFPLKKYKTVLPFNSDKIKRQDYMIYYRLKLDKVVAEWTEKMRPDRRDYVNFAKYIGFPNFDEKTQDAIRGHYIVDIENPQIQRILDLADGPNLKTILKMVHIKAINREEADVHNTQ